MNKLNQIQRDIKTLKMVKCHILMKRTPSSNNCGQLKVMFYGTICKDDFQRNKINDRYVTRRNLSKIRVLRCKFLKLIRKHRMR